MDKKFNVLVLLSLIFFSFTSAASMVPREEGGGGGGVAFPLRCVDFTGNWRSDFGGSYSIDQSRCDRFQFAFRDLDITKPITSVIVPDNQTRLLEGHEWTGNIRHSWDSTDYGRSIQTVSTKRYKNIIIEETRVLEYVNTFLMLESTYLAYFYAGDDDPVQQESFQRIFRRCEDCDF